MAWADPTITLSTDNHRTRIGGHPIVSLGEQSPSMPERIGKNLTQQGIDHGLELGLVYGDHVLVLEALASFFLKKGPNSKIQTLTL